MLKAVAVVRKPEWVSWWRVGTVAMVLPLFLAASGSSSVSAEKSGQVSPVKKLTSIELSTQLLAQKERRIALVIGNGAYGAEGKLINPPNDATDVAQALRDLGFEVTLLKDGGQQEMDEAIEQFSSQLRKGGVGLFYYAGHGVQVSDENYLIPIGAKIKSESDVRYKTIPLGKVIGEMEEAGNPVNIVIIDACRDNPSIRRFTRSASRGLAQLKREPEGMLIAYATAPGDVAQDGDGRNSPYTASLLQSLKKPEVPLQLLFEDVGRAVRAKTGGQQRPRYTSAGVDYAFKSSPSGFIVSPPSRSPGLLTVPPRRNEPTLISKATGIDYTPLRDLLTAGKWKEADQETIRVLFQATRQEEKRFGLDFDKLPCEDLRTVDQLWQDMSRGKFGFSVQYQIYKSLGGTRNDWGGFASEVGMNGGIYDTQNFTINAKRGALPTGWGFGGSGTPYELPVLHGEQLLRCGDLR